MAINNPLWESDLWTGEGLSNADLAEQKLWQREMFDQMFPLVTIKRLSFKNTQVDQLRGEPSVTWGRKGRKRPADRARRFEAPIKCRAYIDHRPRQEILIKYGMDKPRDVIFTFLDFVLEELHLEIKPGDVVEFEGQDFELQTVHQPTESYWINTEFKFYVIASATKYRTEGNRKVDYGGNVE
jgi:hypothetical protein